MLKDKFQLNNMAESFLIFCEINGPCGSYYETMHPICNVILLGIGVGSLNVSFLVFH